MAFRPHNTKERTLHRLKIAQGHLNKVMKMVENDEYCIDVIHQSRAVQSALKKVDTLVLDNHLKSCVSNSIKKGNDKQVIEEVMNIFNKSF